VTYLHYKQMKLRKNTNITNLQTDASTLQANETTQNTNITNLPTDISTKVGLDTTNIFSAQNLFRKIGETNQTITVASGFLTLNSNTSHVAYVTPQTANFQTRITNIVVANNTTFTFSLVIDTSTNNFFCNTLQVNGTTRTMLFPNGIATVNISTSTKVCKLSR
jgi:hypothetical protein